MTAKLVPIRNSTCCGLADIAFADIDMDFSAGKYR